MTRLINRKSGECPYPIDAEPSARMRICAAPVKVGSYCECHAALCYAKNPEKLEPSIQIKSPVSGLTLRRREAARALMDMRGWA